MILQAVEHIRPMKGGAQSQLMRADDQQYYVVKFLNNPQHPRVLANELLTARLAHSLGLPVPPAALMQVAATLIENAPGMVIRMAGQLLRCGAGLQFASRLPVQDPSLPIYDYLPELGLDTIVNLCDFGGMLVFDKWTCNCNGRQVVFCRPSPRQRMRVYMIDQGFCFNAGDWNFPDSPLRGVYSRNIVYKTITGWDSFEPWLSRVEELDPDVIYRAGEEIPPHWYGGDPDDLQRLLDLLVGRRRHVRELILAVKNSPRAPFENWR